MKRSIGVACSILLSASCPLAYTDARYYPATGHWYEDVPGGNWYTAEANAVALGGHLVTINDAAEQQWLYDRLFNDPWNGHQWIGFTDVAVEGQWEWVSGEPVTYTNWAPGEPNNTQGIEHFAIMNWGVGCTWNDRPVQPEPPHLMYTGIAEYPGPPPVPEPTTCATFALGLVAIAAKRRRTN
jgi:hypothetical protein